MDAKLQQLSDAVEAADSFITFDEATTEPMLCDGQDMDGNDNIAHAMATLIIAARDIIEAAE